MSYSLSSDTNPNFGSSSNVVVGISQIQGQNVIGNSISIAIDYTELITTIASITNSHLAEISSHLNNIHMAANVTNSHLAEISYRHRLIHSNIALLAFRGSRQDYGIVTRMSNTDCWIDMCPYDASLLLMGLEEGNTMAYYNEILIENGLSPIVGRKIFENAGFDQDGRRLPQANVFIDRVEEIPPRLDIFNLPPVSPAKPNPEID